MSKKYISHNKKNNQIVIEGNKSQSINLREVHCIAEMTSPAFIKFQIDKESQPVHLSASTRGVISLNDYLCGVSITKLLFVNLIQSMLDSISEVERYRFNRELIVYQTDFVFLDIESLSVVLTYIPLSPLSLEGSLKTLLNEFIQKASFDSEEDITYVKDFLKIVNGNEFSLFVLQEFLEYISPNGNVAKREDYRLQLISCPICRMTIDKDAVLCEYCGTNLKRNKNLSFFQDTFLQKRGYGNSNRLMINEDDSGRIIVFRAAKQHDYSIESELDGSVVQINHSPFIIGKMPETFGLQIKNDMVSRKHAQIIQEGNSLYLVDLGSRNGTYINGRRIESGMNELICDKDVISFANVRYYVKENGGE